jgi:hypothetical protein
VLDRFGDLPVAAVIGGGSHDLISDEGECVNGGYGETVVRPLDAVARLGQTGAVAVG